MRAAKHLRTETKKAARPFNVGVAGWVLSVLTFAAGTVVPSLYSRFAFDGVTIAVQGDPKLTIRGNTLGIGFDVRVANASNAAVVVESIETNIQELLTAAKPKLTDREAWLEDQVHGGDNNLPLLIPKECVRILGFKEYYDLGTFFAGVKPADDAARASRLSALAPDAELQIRFMLNGKFRALSVAMGKIRVAPLELRMPPPPPPPGTNSSTPEPEPEPEPEPTSAQQDPCKR